MYFSMYSDFLGVRRLPQPPLKNATLHLSGVTRLGLETRSSRYFLDLHQSEQRQCVTSQSFIQSSLFFIRMYKNVDSLSREEDVYGNKVLSALAPHV